MPLDQISGETRRCVATINRGAKVGGVSLFASEKGEGKTFTCFSLSLFVVPSRRKKLSRHSFDDDGLASRFTRIPDVNLFVRTQMLRRRYDGQDQPSCRVCIPNRSLRTPLLSRGVFVRHSSRRRRPSIGEVGRAVTGATAPLARQRRRVAPIGPFESLNVAGAVCVHSRASSRLTLRLLACARASHTLLGPFVSFFYFLCFASIKKASLGLFSVLHC